MSPPSPFETRASPAPQDEGGTESGDQGNVRSEIYRESGVDTAEADAGLSRIIARLQKTRPRQALGRLVLPIGDFANVIHAHRLRPTPCPHGGGSQATD